MVKTIPLKWFKHEEDDRMVIHMAIHPWGVLSIVEILETGKAVFQHKVFIDVSNAKFHAEVEFNFIINKLIIKD